MLRRVHYSLGFVLFLLGSTSCSVSPNFLVVAPDVLQVGRSQFVTASVFGTSETVAVTVHVETWQKSVISQGHQQSLQPGQPKLFKVEIPYAASPTPDSSGNRYVYVRAFSTNSSLSFDKRIRVLLSLKACSTFIQTDKPVYRKNDNVHIRVVAVGPDLKLVRSNVSVDIKNPQNITVDRLRLRSDIAITSHTLHLGPRPVEGNWFISVTCGYEEENSVVQSFKVSDYVLPRFSVMIKPPKSVSASDSVIKLEVDSKYTYGKMVIGRLHLELAVLDQVLHQKQAFWTADYSLHPHRKEPLKLEIPNKGYGLFPHGKLLWIHAEVVEEASAVNQSVTDISAVFSNQPIKVDCSLTPPIYRPGIPLMLKVRAEYPDGSPAVDKFIKAKVPGDSIAKEEKTSSTGEAQMRLNMIDYGGTVTVAVTVDNQPVDTDCTFQRFETPCTPFTVKFVTRSTTLKVNDIANFEIIKANGNNQQLPVTVTVTARGLIQSAMVLDFRATQNDNMFFQLHVTSQLSNRFCLLAYMVDNCRGEDMVVSDYTCVDVEETFSNNIAIELLSPSVVPGAKMDMKVLAAPFSHVALLALDSGLNVLNKAGLSRDGVFSELRSYDMYCQSSGAASSDMFETIGLASMTDMNFQTRERKTLQCAKREKRDTTESLSDNDDCFCKDATRLRQGILLDASNVTQLRTLITNCDETIRNVSRSRTHHSCRPTTSGLHKFEECCLNEDSRAKNADLFRGQVSAVDVENLLEDNARNNFPHVWLWDEDIHLGDQPFSQLQDLRVPDTITDWIIHGIGFSLDEGFAVAKPVTLSVFKSLFLECHAPYALIRREQISLTCTAFNYGNEELSNAWLRVVRPSDDICTTTGVGHRAERLNVAIPSNDRVSFTIPIVPLKTGNTSLIVQLLTSVGVDQLEKQLFVKPEGALQIVEYAAGLDPQGLNTADTLSCSRKTTVENLIPGTCHKHVDGDGRCGEMMTDNVTMQECCVGKIKSFSVAWSRAGVCHSCQQKQEILLCDEPNVPKNRAQENSFRIQVPENTVPNSVSAWLSVSGQYLLGNVEPIQDISDRLVGIHGGECGEQTMSKIGPNVAIVKYLRHTNQLTERKREQYRTVIQRGFQHALHFFKPDSGGFAPYPHDDSTTWLTAFAVQTFCSAKKFANVSAAPLKKSANFVCQAQTLFGIFKEVKDIKRHLAGGVQDQDLSLTAFSVISLLECWDDVKKQLDVIQISTNCVCAAVVQMQAHVARRRITRPFTRAIVHYALQRACTETHICNCGKYSLLKSRQTLDITAIIDTEGSKHWNDDYGSQNSAIAVETTAYALCGYVAAGDIKGARPIVKWLTNARNANGAFRSTQDTVVALNCLSKFSNYIDMKRSLVVKVAAKHDTGFSHVFNVNDINTDERQSIQIPVDDILLLKTTGTGLATAQVHLEYNVDDVSREKCSFEFNVNARQSQTISTSDGSKRSIIIRSCARYRGTGDTNAAVVIVELPTGYVACDTEQKNDQFCLKFLQNQWRDPIVNLTMYSITDTKVWLYFNKISSDQRTCVEFRALQNFAVKNQVPVSARVLDYYDPNNKKCTVFYTLDGSQSTLNTLCDTVSQNVEPICVCGAGRCPKLRPVSNRTCKACHQSSFVYHVKVLTSSQEGMWLKTETLVLDVIKPGLRKVIPNKTVLSFWMAEACNISDSSPLVFGEEYHIMGLDGFKLVLDHTSNIELWPPRLLQRCVGNSKINLMTDCMKPCHKKNMLSRKQRSCKKRRRPMCQRKVERDSMDKCSNVLNYREYETYYKNMKDNKGHVCELNVCG